ncbi:hypothetical protein [Desulfurobacterium sp.]
MRSTLSRALHRIEEVDDMLQAKKDTFRQTIEYLALARSSIKSAIRKLDREKFKLYKGGRSERSKVY